MHAIRLIGLSDRALLGSAVEMFGAGSTSIGSANDGSANDGSGTNQIITRFVADARTFAFVAVDAAEEVIGWSWGEVVSRPDGGGTAQIGALAVVADQRRKGVGTLLFEAAYGHARRAGAVQLVSYVDDLLDETATAFLDQMQPALSSGTRVRWAL